jgi:hypothetical protein
MKANSLGLIVIAGALFFMFGKPQLADLDALSREKDSYNQAISDLNTVEEKKNQLLARLNAVPEENIKRIDTMLPDKANIVGLVAEIDSIAGKRGILIRNIETGQPANFASAVGEVAPPKDYNSTTLTFDFDSNYDNMKYLLTELESSLRLLDIRSVSFGTSEKPGQQNYKVSMDVYWSSAARRAQEAAVIVP